MKPEVMEKGYFKINLLFIHYAYSALLCDRKALKCCFQLWNIYSKTSSHLHHMQFYVYMAICISLNHSKMWCKEAVFTVNHHHRQTGSRPTKHSRLLWSCVCLFKKKNKTTLQYFSLLNMLVLQLIYDS